MCKLMAKRNSDNGYVLTTLLGTLFLDYFSQALRIKEHAVATSSNFVHNSRGSYRMLVVEQNHPKTTFRQK